MSRMSYSDEERADQDRAILYRKIESLNKELAANEIGHDARMQVMKDSLDAAQNDVRDLIVERDSLRAEIEALRKENKKLTDVLLSKHGGECLSLLDELDDARAESERLRAENEALRKALEPMTKGTHWITHADVRRAYEALGVSIPWEIDMAGLINNKYNAELEEK